MGHKFGRRVTLRDAVIEELKAEYPSLRCTRKRDAKSFSVWFKRMDFKDGWDYDHFFNHLGHLRAKFIVRTHRGGILIEVSNYFGYLERRVGEPRLNEPKFINAKSRIKWKNQKV